MSRPRIFDLARERADSKRRQQAAIEQAEMEAQRGRADAVRESLAAVLAEADPTYPALLSALEARPLTREERAEVGLSDDPQDGAVALAYGDARVIARVTREAGRTNSVRWRFYGDGVGPFETTYPYGHGAGKPAVGQEMWWHLLDALAPAAEHAEPAPQAVPPAFL